MKLFKKILLFFTFLFLIQGLYIFLAPQPMFRAQKIIFKYYLPPLQYILGLKAPDRTKPFFGFAFEKPEVLISFKTKFSLDTIVANLTNDFEKSVQLMHWVRDQLPHKIPAIDINPQSFNSEDFLKNPQVDGMLCGQTSQILIQALISMGIPARRVELRFTPKDAHAVVEVWSDFYQKWIILDPDYDIYYTLEDIPLNALELHNLWVTEDYGNLVVYSRESPHNIYENNLKNSSIKLLNYYSHLSYPLRNDWTSRPLSWWHPEGNHVQNSLVIEVEGMVDYEDFLLKTKDPKILYANPKTQ